MFTHNEELTSNTHTEETAQYSSEMSQLLLLHVLDNYQHNVTFPIMIIKRLSSCLYLRV